jgi:hypothetical protein
LVWFIKEDLSTSEVNEISGKIEEYIQKRDDLENKLKDQIDT